MFFKSITFSFYLSITILFTYPLYASDYCIFLKDGRKILAFDHWYEEEKLHAEITDGATLIIDKNQVVRIVDTEKFDNNSIENKLEKRLSKYETEEAIIVLSDGRNLKIRKSWIEGNKVYCLNNQSISIFNFDDIVAVQTDESTIDDEIFKEGQFVKEDSIIPKKIKTHSKLKNKKNIDYVYRDGPTEDFTKNGVFYKFLGFTVKYPFCSGYSCPKHGQWYETENGEDYCWDQKANKLRKDSSGLRLRQKWSPGWELSRNKIVDKEPPKADFSRNGFNYKYIGTIRCPNAYSDSCRLYETENGKQYYWNKSIQGMYPRKRG